MFIARIVQKAEKSDRKMVHTFECQRYSVEEGEVKLFGVDLNEEKTINVSPKDPPEDTDGIWSQRVFIMNSNGKTIDQYLVNPSGGFK